jgi:hypothetical protein
MLIAMRILRRGRVRIAFADLQMDGRQSQEQNEEVESFSLPCGSRLRFTF